MLAEAQTNQRTRDWLLDSGWTLRLEQFCNCGCCSPEMVFHPPFPMDEEEEDAFLFNSDGEFRVR